jgi:hypothetical protein
MLHTKYDTDQRIDGFLSMWIQIRKDFTAISGRQVKPQKFQYEGCVKWIDYPLDQELQPAASNTQMVAQKVTFGTPKSLRLSALSYTHLLFSSLGCITMANLNTLPSEVRYYLNPLPCTHRIYS